MLKTQVDLELQKHHFGISMPSDSIVYKCLIAATCSIITFVMFKPSLRTVLSHIHLLDPLMRTQYNDHTLKLIEYVSHHMAIE